MKNTEKTVYIISICGGYVGAFTNMKSMYEALESQNNEGTCDSKTVWEDFPTYQQCLSKKKKERDNGYLFSMSLRPFDNYASGVEITETYLNKGSSK